MADFLISIPTINLPTLSTPVLLFSFVVQAFCTVYMCGVIWMVQLVHYPLLNRVGEINFPAYAKRHAQRTTLVVGPPMLMEAATSVISLYQPLPGVPKRLWLGGILLVIVVWWCTAMLSVPQHRILQKGFNEKSYRLLVGTNWIRTVAWSLRSIIILSAFLYFVASLSSSEPLTPWL